MTSDLSVADIAARLQTARYGRSLEVLDVTESTNDVARAGALAGAASGHTVIADHQSAGRGSRGRTWSSPAGTDLYLSIVDRPTLPLAALPPLTLAVGLGVADGVDAALGGSPAARVKWPNDVRVAERKCAGILVEAVGNVVVIGIGLNVNRRQWPAELTDIATSLAEQSGRDHDRVAVLAALLLGVERWVDRFVAEGADPVVQALAERMAWIGRQVRCGDVEGRLQGVTPDGAALVHGPTGPQRLIAGTLELVDPPVDPPVDRGARSPK